MQQIKVTISLTPEIIEALQEILIEASKVVHLNLVSIKQASEITGYSESYLRLLCRKKLIDFHQPAGPGGKIFFTRDALKNFMKRYLTTKRRGRPRRGPSLTSLG